MGATAMFLSICINSQARRRTISIGYPIWSPDGKWLLFDRFRPQGGDIWMIKNFE
jgi:Tol biopolymer transport system component